MAYTYLEAVKRIAHKVGFDEAEAKEIVLALTEEHGSKAEVAAARLYAYGPDAVSTETAFQKSVDAEIARRAAKASEAAAKKANRAKKAEPEA